MYQTIQNALPTFGRNGRAGGAVPAGRLSVIPDPAPKPAAEKTEGAADELTAVASVVVTIAGGNSYDNLFRQLPQESEYGRVAVYLLSPGQIMRQIQEALMGNEVTSDVVKKLRDDCNEAGADAVCFNFECSSGYGDQGFVQDGNAAFKTIYLDLIEFLVKDFGCMTMFSDFSLKALLNDWDNDRFGAKPFAKVAEFSGDLRLGFDPDQLKKSPSAQLNTVANLADDGSAQLHAMGGTVVFTLTETGRQMAEETLQMDEGAEGRVMEPFEVQVLTVATMLSAPGFTGNKMNEVEADDQLACCEIGDKKGLAGHILLTFPASERNINKHIVDMREQEEERTKAIKEGIVAEDIQEFEVEESSPARGMILASCGHWIELMKLDVNLNRLLETVKEEWGVTSPRYMEMAADVEEMDEAQQATYAKSNAISYVQTRAPAKFNQKNVRKKKYGY